MLVLDWWLIGHYYFGGVDAKVIRGRDGNNVGGTSRNFLVGISLKACVNKKRTNRPCILRASFRLSPQVSASVDWSITRPATRPGHDTFGRRPSGRLGHYTIGRSRCGRFDNGGYVFVDGRLRIEGGDIDVVVGGYGSFVIGVTIVSIVDEVDAGEDAD
eukprot:scaffold32532_cov22-Cyclotella_meneghiniana.AAC.2